MSEKEIAKKLWEMENNIDNIDEIYRYNREEQQDILAVKPWSKEYVFFNFGFGF